MSMRLVITGGGTGGHLFPGIAVADEVLARIPGSEVLFIGTGREIDRRALAAKPYRQATLTGSGLKGISWRGRLASLARLPLGFFQAWRLLREFKPDLVLGVGGYVTGPVLLAARLLGAVTCIHEQNTVPGLANRLLGRFVHLVFLSLPGSEHYFPAAKTRLVGNPLRPELLAAAEKSAVPAARAGEAAPADPSDPSAPATQPAAGLKTSQSVAVLVLGGSQGAHRVNELMLAAATILAGEGWRLELTHQAGQADVAMLESGYRQAGIEARVEAFVTDMAVVYRRADLVVSRAGATTLAELALFGKPALLIPYPYAADDHQRRNAEIMVGEQAAVMKNEAELDGASLAAELRRLLADRPGLAAMGRRARTLARPEAALDIIKECAALAVCSKLKGCGSVAGQR